METAQIFTEILSICLALVAIPYLLISTNTGRSKKIAWAVVLSCILLVISYFGIAQATILSDHTLMILFIILSKIFDIAILLVLICHAYRRRVY